MANMAHHLNPEDGARSSSRQRIPSRALSPRFAHASTNEAENTSPSRLNASESSVSGTETPTMSGPKQAGDRNLTFIASGQNVNIHDGLGSLNRWSESTTSSRSLVSNQPHLRESPTVFGDGDRNMENLTGRAASATDQHPRQYGGVTSMNRNQSQSSYSPQRPQISKPAEPQMLGTSEFASLPAFSNVSAAPTKPGFLFAESLSGNVPRSPALKGDHSPLHSQNMNQSGPGGDEDSPGAYNESRRHRGHSQKAMLSKALQKANTAVLLDNAANFEGAMDAYNEACHLLHSVMLRTHGGSGEKLKLQEIRDTYMIRINELQGMELSAHDTKALPERPVSGESYSDSLQALDDDGRADSDGDMSTVHPVPRFRRVTSGNPQALPPGQVPPRRQSLLPSALDDDSRFMTLPAKSKRINDPSQLRSPQGRPSEHAHLNSQVLGEFDQADGNPEESRPAVESDMSVDLAFRPQYSVPSLLSTNLRDGTESTSWLDTIDESGASSPSSPHSESSSLYLRRRKNSRYSHGTEAEFDAALDAAVEAAYDEGLEPATEFSPQVEDDDDDDDVMANARRNVELAKQRVREAEREAAVAATRGREMRRIHDETMDENSNLIDSDYLDEEAEEEERLLEEMTRGYVMDDFDFDLQSKSALPRQSDSSSFSGRTWESSAASNTTNAGPALTTLAEDDVLPPTETDREPTPHSVPPETLPVTLANAPEVPLPPGPPSGLDQPPVPGVGAQRLSRQNPKGLTIETGTRRRADSEVTGPEQSLDPTSIRPPPVPKDDDIQSSHTNMVLSTATSQGPESGNRNASIESSIQDGETDVGLSKATTQDGYDDVRIPPPARPPIGKVPSAPDNLGKHHSNQKAFRARNVSVPISDATGDPPSTPSSTTFPSADFHKGIGAGAAPPIPPPMGTAAANALSASGLYLLANHIHSPTTPGSPNPAATNGPLPLESCPESFLLRPFWLLRCIYQSIAHPSGGYLSTKLFVPRDVWRVKNVKLKAVEEKVSNCDLLTAALLKLAQVDTFDADAVLEEMQSLESVFDQVQASLSKKLGSDVGVHGAMPLFKLSPSDDSAPTTEPLPSKSSSTSSKSYLTGWRKLRSKNSGVGSAISTSSSRETTKDSLTINSLPMTPTPSCRTKNSPMQLQPNGPNANYMGALARLCDAAQVLDQIAQQVEDPGLKHSSQTLVGLELSTRHAAEFFGFYVCRFVLNDISMMLDKFIKRGSEWVLV